MTDTPKRIYAWAVPPTAPLVGTWSVTRYPDAAEAYILAAEHDRIVAEKEAEIARLREALGAELAAARNQALEDAARRLLRCFPNMGMIDEFAAAMARKRSGFTGRLPSPRRR